MSKKRYATIVLCLMVSAATSYAQSHRGSRFSEWSAPVNLGAPINSTAGDSAPALSKDGRSLYFTSNRTGSIGGTEDIWVAKRKNKKAPWETPINLGPTINTVSIERVRTLSDDGRILLFQSDRVRGQGGFDIWAIVRKHTNDDFGWSEPVNLGTVINTSFNEIAGKQVNAGIPKMFFSSTRTDIGGLGFGDIYDSDVLADGSFGTPVNRFELNSPSVETCFWVRDDGLEIIFSSNRPSVTDDAAAFDLWAATRSNVYETWSAPMNLGPAINSAGAMDVNPTLSSDGKTMFFSSRRDGGLGLMDIYMTTRRRIRGNE